LIKLLDIFFTMKNLFFYLGAFLMLSSCGPKEYSGTYSALNEFNKYVFTDTATRRPQYQNDSLKCSMLLYETFLGNDSCNVISRKEFRHSQKLLALHHILVKPENFVFKTLEPDSFVPIQITLFTIPTAVPLKIIDSE